MIVVRNQNIVSCERGTNTTYAANELNQYTSIVGGPVESEPAFDDDGNQTHVRTATGVWRVTYNGENRPILWEQIEQSEQSNNRTILSMSYDRLGRRVTKNDERFVYDGYLCIKNIGDSSPLHSSLLPINCYVWDPTEPIATRPLVWLCGSTSAYYVFDGNKNVSEVNKDGMMLHYAYAPFGNRFSSPSTTNNKNPFCYSSEYHDSQLGVDAFNFRSYLSVSGRWLSLDPIGFHAGSYPIQYGDSSFVNGYLYLNNGFGNVDSLGLHSISSCDYEYELCSDSCRRIPCNNKKRRALCWAGCSAEYGRCLATARETLLSLAAGAAAAGILYLSGGTAVLFAF